MKSRRGWCLNNVLPIYEEEEKLCSSMTDDNDELGSRPSGSPSSENLSPERHCLSLRRIIRIGTWKTIMTAQEFMALEYKTRGASVCRIFVLGTFEK